MDEVTFQLAQKLLTILETILYAGCFSYFISRMYYKKSQWKKPMTAIFILYTVFYIIKNVFNIPSWVVLIGIFFFVALESILRKNGRKEFLFFLFVTWYCEVYLCYFIGNSLYTVMINNIAKEVSNPQSLYIGMLFVYSFGVFLRVTMIYLMSFLLKRKISSNIKYMNGKEVVYLSLIPLAGVLFGNVISYEGTKVNKTSRKEEVSQGGRTESSSASGAAGAESSDMQKYLSELQKKNSQINVLSGNKDTSQSKNSNSKTDVMIAPSILNQMASDPEAARKYEKMLADIPALDKWADSMIHALTGSEVKYRQVWIDEDGNMGSFCITGPSEETKKAEEVKKKEEQEEFEERIQERREKYREFSERLEKGSEGLAESVYMDSILKAMSVDYKA